MPEINQEIIEALYSALEEAVDSDVCTYLDKAGVSYKIKKTRGTFDGFIFTNNYFTPNKFPGVKPQAVWDSKKGWMIRLTIVGPKGHRSNRSRRSRGAKRRRGIVYIVLQGDGNVFIRSRVNNKLMRWYQISISDPIYLRNTTETVTTFLAHAMYSITDRWELQQGRAFKKFIEMKGFDFGSD